MTPRGTRGLCCVHIAQLMTHPAVYKPLGILQRVTKSQKVHMSSHDGLQKTDYNINLAYPRVFQSGDRVAGICPCLSKY